MASKASKKEYKASEWHIVANAIARGLIAAGYEMVAGESDLYCIKPGRAIVQFVGCKLTPSGGIFCAADKLVIMQGCKKLLEYK